ncbi:porin family protein [Bacteroidota bacterium]
MRNILVIVIFIFLSSLASYGQQSCTQNLLDAQKLFEQGFLEDVPSRLINCLNNKGYSREEETDAYKLIILSYLYDDRHNEAEQYMAKFLKRNPEYELTETDPDVFVYLYSQYDTKPILSAGVRAGGIFSFMDITENHDNDISSIERSGYVYGTGLTVGADFSKNITPKINANLSISFNQIKCADEDTTENPFIFDQDLTYSVSDFSIPYISIPLSFSYDFQLNNNDYKPFVKIGSGLGIILQSKAILTNSAQSSSGDFPDIEPVDRTDIPLMFKPYYWWLLAGAGLKIKIPTGYVVVDISYNRGMSPVINEDENFSYLDVVEKLLEPSEYYIDNMLITVSYRYSIYNPKRKKIR